jgi:hypothetical protein
VNSKIDGATEAHLDAQRRQVKCLLCVHFSDLFLPVPVFFQPRYVIFVVKLQEKCNEGVLEQLASLGTMVRVLLETKESEIKAYQALEIERHFAPDQDLPSANEVRKFD